MCICVEVNLEKIYGENIKSHSLNLERDTYGVILNNYTIYTKLNAILRYTKIEITT